MPGVTRYGANGSYSLIRLYEKGYGGPGWAPVFSHTNAWRNSVLSLGKIPWGQSASHLSQREQSKMPELKEADGIGEHESFYCVASPTDRH